MVNLEYLEILGIQENRVCLEKLVRKDCLDYLAL